MRRLVEIYDAWEKPGYQLTEQEIKKIMGTIEEGARQELEERTRQRREPPPPRR